MATPYREVHVTGTRPYRVEYWEERNGYAHQVTEKDSGDWSPLEFRSVRWSSDIPAPPRPGLFPRQAW